MNKPDIGDIGVAWHCTHTRGNNNVSGGTQDFFAFSLNQTVLVDYGCLKAGKGTSTSDVCAIRFWPSILQILRTATATSSMSLDDHNM